MAQDNIQKQAEIGVDGFDSWEREPLWWGPEQKADVLLEEELGGWISTVSEWLEL